VGEVFALAAKKDDVKADPFDGVELPSDKAAAINRDRMKTYGSPVHVFPRAARIWSAILLIDVTEEQVAACMMGLKLAREAQSDYDPDYLDNNEDICGYANCLYLIKEARRG
jgi:Domain of unknown function (DUF6378)